MAAQAKGGITHEDIIRSVRAGEVKPVYLLMGAEDYYIDKLSDFLTDTLLQPEERDFNLDVVYGLEVTADIVNEGGSLQPSVARAARPARIDDMATYLKWKWRMDVTDPSTGLAHGALKKGLDAVLAEWKQKEPWPVVKARLIDYLVDNTALGFSRFDCFPAISSWNRFDRPMSKIISAREREVDRAQAPAWLADARRRISASGGKSYRDYDHSSA